MERFRTQRGREGEGEGNKKGGGDETRRGKGRAVGGARRDRRTGWEELEKLSLTAMGPLANLGILLEINLSPWSR